MPNIFDTVQYSTNPAGIHANITVNISGIHFITFCVCAVTSFLSILPDGVCKYCCSHIVAPISIGNIKYGSIAAKSEIHKKCALRICTDIHNAMYNAKKIGICISIGKHPDIGDVLCVWYRRNISICNRALSLAYNFWIRAISGCIFCIAIIETYDLRVSGHIAKRINSVKTIIAKP